MNGFKSFQAIIAIYSILFTWNFLRENGLDFYRRCFTSRTRARYLIYNKSGSWLQITLNFHTTIARPYLLTKPKSLNNKKFDKSISSIMFIVVNVYPQNVKGWSVKAEYSHSNRIGLSWQDPELSVCLLYVYFTSSILLRESAFFNLLLTGGNNVCVGSVNIIADGFNSPRSCEVMLRFHLINSKINAAQSTAYRYCRLRNRAGKILVKCIKNVLISPSTN